MPDLIMTTDLQNLLEPILRTIVQNDRMTIPDEFPKYYSVESSKKKTEHDLHLASTGVWQDTAEGADYNLDEIAESYKVSMTHKKVTNSFKITHEMMQDNLYVDASGIPQFTGTSFFTGRAQQLVRGVRGKTGIDAATILTGGFSNVGYDGAPLFSNAHPHNSSVGATTGSNLITGSLNNDTVRQGMTMMRQTLDNNGELPIGASARQLVVGPDNEFSAIQLAHDTWVYGEYGADTNATKTKNENVKPIANLQVVVDPYITVASGATQFPWYLKADKRFKNLLWFWRQEPFFFSEKVNGNRDIRFMGDARYSAGYSDWRGIVGSEG